MNPRIIVVKPLDNFLLHLKFTDHSIREFDMKPYLQYPAFEDLKEENVFKNVTLFLGTVKWNDDIDMSPDTLFLESKLISL
ncbi:MAG: DUF2442 domain-containing protein [Ferruginibacter sp.]